MAPPPQQGQGDNSLGPLWIIVGLFVLGLFIWYYGHEYIALVIYKISEYEIRFINFVTRGYFQNNLMPAQVLMIQYPPANATFSDLERVSIIVGKVLRYPLAVIFALCAIHLIRKNPRGRFRSSFDMKKLLSTEKDSWPAITPVGELDLVNSDIDKGPWAMSMQPMQFAKKYDLLDVTEHEAAENMLSKYRRTQVELRKGKTNQIFAMQMGVAWRGVDKLKIHEQALFAAFAARACRDANGANNLLFQIAASARTGKLDFSGVQPLLDKYKNNKLVKQFSDKHGYVLTVMATMLELARTDGVFASAEFIWLKPLDRKLWYMLNNVGRRTAFPEVAGPFAHWLAEKELQRPLSVPMIDEATHSLAIAISEIIYQPDEEKAK